mmetsp:Transcript_29189/g.35757  ORF Transcript_29189/g.35757 Transcript_29189/m.35757 type:complete len:139 (+) Transcript_29189:47-463(+)
MQKGKMNKTCENKYYGEIESECDNENNISLTEWCSKNKLLRYYESLLNNKIYTVNDLININKNECNILISNINFTSRKKRKFIMAVDELKKNSMLKDISKQNSSIFKAIKRNNDELMKDNEYEIIKLTEFNDDGFILL